MARNPLQTRRPRSPLRPAPGRRSASPRAADPSFSLALALVFSVVLLLGPGGGLAKGSAPAAGESPSGPGPGWSLLWRDDFEGEAGSPPSPDEWIIATGTNYPGGPANWGTGEVQIYTADPGNVSLDGDGHLVITPIRLASGRWTSARIETRRAFMPPEGGALRIEGRIRLPAVTGVEAAGYWPAFWALGAPYRGDYWNWPSVGEFDIMENVNGIDRIWQAVHCGTTPGGPCNEPSGIGTSAPCPPPGCREAFHVYAFEWDRSTRPNELRWYIDGELTFRVLETRFPAATWAAMTQHGYFLLINVAMGGGFPAAFGGGPTAGTRSGAPLVVDYVAVYVRQ